jgi:hypothetical protein
MRTKRNAVAWLCALVVPLLTLCASGLGCELVIGDLDTTLLDGSPSDVVLPMTLDGYHCSICRDVSPEASFEGDMFFPEAGAEGGAGEGGGARDGGAEASRKDGAGREAGDAGDAG